MAMINREALNGRDDFIGFTFKDRHSSEFNIIRVSGGNRLGKELLPSPKDTTIQVVGRDGLLYYTSSYGERKFDISLAFNDLREEDFRAMQYWLADKSTGKLIFDEEPYKAWDVKISAAPKFNFICFDEVVGGKKIRVYKGEGTLQFISYSIIAKAPFPFLEAYNWDFVNHKGGYDASAWHAKENEWRTEQNTKNLFTSWERHLLINDKDSDSDLQMEPYNVLDTRLGQSITAPERLIEWYNFNEWKDVSRIKTQEELDIPARGWESIICGYYTSKQTSMSVSASTRTELWNNIKEYKKDGDETVDESGTLLYDETPANNRMKYRQFMPQRRAINCVEPRYRRYGYCLDTIFMSGINSYERDIIKAEYSSKLGRDIYGYHIQSRIEENYKENDWLKNKHLRVLLDHQYADHYDNLFNSLGSSSQGYTKGNIIIMNDDYRRKVTRYYNVDNETAMTEHYCYKASAATNQYAKYKEVSKKMDGLGTDVTVIDPWAGKIGPTRGITGDKIYIYNPGNYKTYPKIIITVLDKRSMITRSRINYPGMTVKYADKTYNATIWGLDLPDHNGNYNWKYATFSLYPRYKRTDAFPYDSYTEDDLIGRFTLDLSKLTPTNSKRDKATAVNNVLTLSEADSPNQLTYVIDCELRLIYRVDWNTNPDLGWGPSRSVTGIDSNGNSGTTKIQTPFQYYNTTFTPRNVIKNDAMVAGDFFEVPPYDLDIWNHKELNQGEYMIDVNGAGSSVLGPYSATKHWSSMNRKNDYTWIAQRVVWDINYL